jgi:hypothetical protein
MSGTPRYLLQKLLLFHIKMLSHRRSWPAYPDGYLRCNKPKQQNWGGGRHSFIKKNTQGEQQQYGTGR